MIKLAPIQHISCSYKYKFDNYEHYRLKMSLPTYNFEKYDCKNNPYSFGLFLKVNNTYINNNYSNSTGYCTCTLIMTRISGLLMCSDKVKIAVAHLNPREHYIYENKANCGFYIRLK